MKLLGLLALTSQILTASNKKDGRAVIVLSVNNGREKVIFPVVPANIPDVSLPQNNETFNSILGDMSVIGLMGLRKISFDGLLPKRVKKYSWANGDDALTIINFINKYRLEYVPFRLVITRGDNVYLNMAVLVDNFKYSQDNIGDYHYSIEFTEYRMRDAITGGLTS